jgi:hypothetical protein
MSEIATTVSARAERRAALEAMLDRWFAALVAGSAEGLPISDTFRFTEQATRLPLGEGLFVSATQVPGDFKILVTDEVSGNVAAIVMMGVWDKPALVTVRLKIAHGRISEAEQIVVQMLLPHGLANLQTPRPALLEDCPPEQRTMRDEMWAIANSYFDGVEQDDGTLCPFTDDCARRENGMQTTVNPDGPAFPIREDASPERAAAMRAFAGMSCREQLSTGLMTYINAIRPRRLQVIDEVRGLVLGFPCFGHRGWPRRYPVTGVPGYEMHEMAIGPNTLQASELFQIRSGRVTAVEATGYMKPYMAPTGWDDLYPETYEYEVTHPRTHPFKGGKGPFFA